MNTQRDLGKRLLKLFPIKIVKEYFKLTGNADDVIEEISGDKSLQTIKKFAFSSLNSTKHHLYFFELDTKIKRSHLDDDFPFTIEDESVSKAEFKIFLLPRISYNVVAFNPLESLELHFLQPIQILIKGSQLIIDFTIIEKNVKSYFNENRNAITTRGATHESETLETLIAYFATNFGVATTDLNKGVKYLWENDYIDSKKSQWLNDVSTSSEIMHIGYTLKESRPKVYASLINAPLEKTIFKYLKDDDYFCDEFSVDPCSGQVSFPKYPKDENQIVNVITEILKYN